jgi:hypothetical protein
LRHERRASLSLASLDGTVVVECQVRQLERLGTSPGAPLSSEWAGAGTPSLNITLAAGPAGRNDAVTRCG